MKVECEMMQSEVELMRVEAQLAMEEAQAAASPEEHAAATAHAVREAVAAARAELMAERETAIADAVATALQSAAAAAAKAQERAVADALAAAAASQLSACAPSADAVQTRSDRSVSLPPTARHSRMMLDESESISPMDVSARFSKNLVESSSSTEFTMNLNLEEEIDLHLKVSPNFFTPPFDRIGQYEVVGPAEKMKMIQIVLDHRNKTTRGNKISNMTGALSPPHTITLPPDARRHAGLPADAEYFAFAYPAEGMEAALEQLNNLAEHPWAFMILLGGFVYFRADKSVCRINGLTAMRTSTEFSLVGQLAASDAAVTALLAQKRMRDVTHDALEKEGYISFAWVHPNERFDGVPLNVNRGDTYPHGAFAYLQREGGPIFFKLTKPERASDHDLDVHISQVFSPLYAIWRRIRRDMKTVSKEEAELRQMTRHAGPTGHRSHFGALIYFRFFAPILVGTTGLLSLGMLARYDRGTFEVVASLIWGVLYVGCTWRPLRDTSGVAVLHSEAVRAQRRGANASASKFCSPINQLYAGLIFIATINAILTLSCYWLGEAGREARQFAIAALQAFLLYVFLPLHLYRLRCKTAMHVKKEVETLQKTVSTLTRLRVDKQSVAHNSFSRPRSALASISSRFASSSTRSSRPSSNPPSPPSSPFIPPNAPMLSPMSSMNSQASLPSPSPSPGARWRKAGRWMIAAHRIAKGGGSAGEAMRSMRSIHRLSRVSSRRTKSMRNPRHEDLETKMALRMQAAIRRRLARTRVRELLKRREASLLKFSVPIFITSLLDVVGNTILVEYLHRSEVVPPAYILISLLLPLPAVATLLWDLGRKDKPRFSLTHCVFFVSVLYRLSHRATQVDSFMWNFLDDAIGGLPGDFLDSRTLVPLLTMVCHFIVFMTVTVLGVMTLRIAAVHNSCVHLLFYFQFFDHFFLYVFFGLRSITNPMSPVWLVQQLLLQVFVFLRNSGTTDALISRFLKTGGTLVAAFFLQERAVTFTFADPLSDPLYRLQYIARLAVQFDLADFTAILITPIAVTFFVLRDGWFTLEGTGILIRDCDLPSLWGRFGFLLLTKPVASMLARLYLIRKMRKTLLGKKTIHGTSLAAINALAHQRTLRSEKMSNTLDESKQQEKLHLTEEELASVRDELLLSTLNFRILARKLLHQYDFFAMVVLLQLFLALPVRTSAPVDPSLGGLPSDPSSVPFFNVARQSVWMFVPPPLAHASDERLRDALNHTDVNIAGNHTCVSNWRESITRDHTMVVDDSWHAVVITLLASTAIITVSCLMRNSRRESVLTRREIQRGIISYWSKMRRRRLRSTKKGQMTQVAQASPSLQEGANSCRTSNKMTAQSRASENDDDDDDDDDEPSYEPSSRLTDREASLRIGGQDELDIEDGLLDIMNDADHDAASLRASAFRQYRSSRGHSERHSS